MSTHLEQMITSARALDGAWDAERSERVREGALRLRDVRVRRHRAVRRGLLVVSGAGLLVLGLLRAASSAPVAQATPSATATSTTAATGAAADVLASHTLADAGYARD